jgi:hypothetical protein
VFADPTSSVTEPVLSVVPEAMVVDPLLTVTDTPATSMPQYWAWNLTLHAAQQQPFPP